MSHFDQELDLSGLNCPLPLLKTKHALSTLGAGKVLQVIGTDPGSEKEFRLLGNQPDIELVSFAEVGGKFIYQLKKTLARSA